MNLRPTTTCPVCHGGGLMPGIGGSVPCAECRGEGWVANSGFLAQSAHWGWG